MNKNVYVTQIPHRVDVETKSFLPTVNVSSASDFGEIVIMSPPRGGFYDAKLLKESIAAALKNFNNLDDCLLPLGDPTLCAASAAFLGRRFDYFDVLRWDKTLGRYTKNRVVV